MPPFDFAPERAKTESKAQPCDRCDLDDLAFCSGLMPKDVERLTEILGQIQYAGHDTIFREGDPALHLFSVTEGTVKLYKLLPDGRRQITGFLMAGDFFGIPNDSGYAYSAEAVTPVTLCRFPRAKLEGVLTELPTLEKRLLNLAMSELAAAHEQMLVLGRKTAKEKVASFLLMLSQRSARRGRSPENLILAMGRSDIADYLGLTIETVSRVLTQFKKNGVIALPDLGHVVLREPGRLKHLSDGS